MQCISNFVPLLSINECFFYNGRPPGPSWMRKPVTKSHVLFPFQRQAISPHLYQPLKCRVLRGVRQTFQFFPPTFCLTNSSLLYSGGASNIFEAHYARLSSHILWHRCCSPFTSTTQTLFFHLTRPAPVMLPTRQRFARSNTATRLRCAHRERNTESHKC